MLALAFSFAFFASFNGVDVDDKGRMDEDEADR